MSEEKKPKRTKEEVSREYSNLAFKAGNIQYQIHALKRDLSLLNDSMLSLNLEYPQADEAPQPVEIVEAPKDEPKQESEEESK